MLVCTLDGDLYPPLEEPTGTTDPKSKKKDKDKDKKFVCNHGSEYTHTHTHARARARRRRHTRHFGWILPTVCLFNCVNFGASVFQDFKVALCQSFNPVTLPSVALQSPYRWRTHARGDSGRRQRKRYWHLPYFPWAYLSPSSSSISLLHPSDQHPVSFWTFQEGISISENKHWKQELKFTYK